MRKAGPKLHWQGRGLLVALALAAGILGLLLVSGSVRAVPPPFNASASTDVSDTEHLANADIDSTFDVGDAPWPAAMYTNQVSFTPAAWGVPESADIPMGAVVGRLASHATLGWFNGTCTSGLDLAFDPLVNCSIDTSDTIAYDDPEFFADSDGNGLYGGCDKYPEFLNTMFPGMMPRTRHAGFENIGIWVTLSFMTFEPGTSIPLPGLPPSFSSDLGYVAMSVLNDPTAPLVPNQITDMCPPLSTATTYYGLTLDNPDTAENEAGYAWRTNPAYGGTYTFNGYASSIRDADSDGIDNELDTCPHIATASDPKVPFSGDADGDGLEDACDPEPDTSDYDIDGDTFPNRQDNCPLVANEDQADGDYDGIGDVCDVPDWNGDFPDDEGIPTGFSPTTPNGDFAEVWFETDIEISGPAPPEPGADSDGDGFDDATEADLGSCWEDPCDDEKFCSDTEAADSTPEDVSVAGTCTDEEDNDLDGYIDDVDGGCGDDTDGDGASDEGEEELGSDPEDADSTPEDASVCDVCTDGVDNDGDGDIDGADEGCAEEEVTPTPTPEEGTPTPTPELEICPPVFPGTYSGLVRVDGQPAASGYQVTASIDGIEWGSAIVSGGRYAMDIPDHLPSEAPCFEGGTISFELNGMTCTPVEEGADVWASGLHNVDLSCAAVVETPTPTPEVTPEVTPTPTVTPTTVPPTGAGGLTGPSPGLPLWAMALASWAGLTIVAGLGTLVAAKRR